MNLADPGLNGQPFLQNPRVKQTRRTLLIIWGAMIVSMGWVTVVFSHTLKAPVVNSPIMPVVAIFFAVSAFVIPNWVSRRLNPLAQQTNLDAVLGMILVNHILRFALTEAAMIVLLLAYHGTTAAYSFYGAACGLMLFHFPSIERIEALAGR